jgi:hypothetical protein
VSGDAIGCGLTGGERWQRDVVMEQVIETKRGNFGFVRVTIPLRVKDTMLNWCRQSGMSKAEFFRVSLMMGVIQLAEQVKAKDPEEGYLENE